jgi:hypothetical protein
VAVPVELRQVAERAAPVTLARERTLPVLEALQPLLPDGALARGSVVGVRGGAGATSLALALAAGASQAGSWTVVLGLPSVGLAAAAELGVALDRLALVALPAHDPTAWAPALAAVVGAVDVVVLDGRVALRAGEVRRLTARARERGTVVVPVVPGDLAVPPPAPRDRSARPAREGRGRADVPVGPWTTDLTLTAEASAWEGLGGGHGHLRRRRVAVAAEGRGRAARPRRTELWLPAPGGGVAPASPIPSAAPGPATEGRPAPAPGRRGGPRRLRAVPDAVVEGWARAGVTVGAGGAGGRGGGGGRPVRGGPPVEGHG